MIIEKDTFTKEAVAASTRGEAYDKELLAQEVAYSLANKLYSELGGIKAMSLKDVDHFKSAFFTIAMSLIDWSRVNRKVYPEEYADTSWRIFDPEEGL